MSYMNLLIHHRFNTMFYFIFLFSSVLAIPLVSQAEMSAEQYGVTINLAGKQRMLTQKMSKEALLVALKISPEANANALFKTISLFDKTLVGLKSGNDSLGLVPTSDARTLKQLEKVSALWLEVKPDFDAIAAAKTADKSQIAIIADKNLPLLKQMNRAVLMYEKLASKGAMSENKASATAINLAGKQRMLTQKMSKEALLVAFGHEADDNQINLLDSFSLFDRTLVGLKKGDETLGLVGTNDDEILSQLAKVSTLWANFMPVVKSIADSGQFDDAKIKKIADSNLPLLKEMNKAVKLFEVKH